VNTIPKSEPVLKSAAKPTATATVRPTESRQARSARIAALSPKGWQLVSRVKVGDCRAGEKPPATRTRCTCNGLGWSAYIIEPVGLKNRSRKGGDDDTYRGADWADIDAGLPGLIWCGANCLHYFGLAV